MVMRMTNVINRRAIAPRPMATILSPEIKSELIFRIYCVLMSPYIYM